MRAVLLRQEWDSNPRRFPSAAFKAAALGLYATLPGCGGGGIRTREGCPWPLSGRLPSAGLGDPTRAEGARFERARDGTQPAFRAGAIGRTRRTLQARSERDSNPRTTGVGRLATGSCAATPGHRSTSAPDGSWVDFHPAALTKLEQRVLIIKGQRLGCICRFQRN